MNRGLLAAGLMATALLVGGATDDLDAQIKGSEKASLTQTIDGTNFAIEYSRPSLRGRTRAELWGEQIPHGTSWTPGANWATTFESNKDFTMAGVPVPAGKYSLWMQVEPEAWEFILDPRDSLFHTVHPEPTDDQIRFPVIPGTAPSSVETLAWSFPAVRSTGADLRMQWGTLTIDVEIVVEPTMKTTVSPEEADPFLGTYSVTIPKGMLPPDAEGDRVFDIEIQYRDEHLLGEVEYAPGESFWAFLIPRADGVFAMGFGVNGQLGEVDSSTLWEFEIDDEGRATAFEVRFGNDSLWMSGVRDAGS